MLEMPINEGFTRATRATATLSHNVAMSQLFQEKESKMAKKKAKFLTMKSQVRMISIKCYDEQLPNGWEETSRKIKQIAKDEWIVIAIKHDRDSVTDEVWAPPLEKAHYHIIVKFVNGEHPRVKNILEALGVVYRPLEDETLWKNHGVEPIEEWVSMVTYLPHLTDDAIREGKYKYPLEEIVSNLSVIEIEDIMSNYIHKVKDTDIKALDREAYEKGYSLSCDFEDWYNSLDFEIRRKGDMKIIKDTFYYGVQKRVDESMEITRLCVYIQGDSNIGKTNATKKALGEMRCLIPSPGTGKFDRLKPTTQAIILDDDVCPDLLQMTDNYVCMAHRRNKHDQAWMGDYFIVTSNTSFDEWLKASGIEKEEHIKAMKTRFYICFVCDKMLVCESKCTRGTKEKLAKRDNMYREFKNKFDEEISKYNPQENKNTVVDVNGNAEMVCLFDKFIEKLKKENDRLTVNGDMCHQNQVKYNNQVIAQFTKEKKECQDKFEIEMLVDMYTDEIFEDEEEMLEKYWEEFEEEPEENW